jgi:glycerophosphoryl diester phosphodiesterase
VSEATAPVAQPFHVIAHRGASAYAPENTLPAFERALALGAFEVELDLRLSRDGTLFLFHDSTLDGKTDGRGRVSDHTAQELRVLEIGSWFDRAHPGRPTRYAGTRLISLRELFEHFAAAPFYHLEIKGAQESIAPRITELVNEFDLAGRVMVTSFSREQLQRVKKSDVRLPICLLVPRVRKLREMWQGEAALESLPSSTTLELQRRWIEHARDAGFQQVGIAASDMTREIVQIGHQAGLEVRGWGVKHDRDMHHVIAAGANGMTIDWPDRLLERLR